MRLRQSPMIEASAMMAITLALFFVGYWMISGDIQQVMAGGPILASMLLFPAFVLWLLFANFTKHAKLSTRFLTSLAVTLAISAFGALLMQPSSTEGVADPKRAILIIALVCLDFALSGTIAAAICYGWLLRDKKTPDATLITKPIVPTQKRKKK